MTLALPVYHPCRHDTVLLREGVELTDRMISRLREIEYLPEIWIQCPGIEVLGDYFDARTIEAQATLTHQVREALDLVARGAHAKLNYLDYHYAIGAMIRRLRANPDAAVFFQEMVARDQPALRHAANVCLISLMMGLKLESYMIVQRSRLAPASARIVANLGVGAMLHDVGMLRLDAETLARWSRDHNENDPKWREHVQIGFDMVKSSVAPAAAAAVLHHHQRFDGSGFPTRVGFDGKEIPVRGSEIHIFARIVAVADLFDRLRQSADAPGGERLPGPSIPTVRALAKLRRPPYDRWIDPMVYKALLAVVPAYAPGLPVRLSNGLECVVIEWHPTNPCRPTVQAIDEVDADAAAPKGRRERYDLRDHANLTIVHAEGEDVSGDNFFAQSPRDFDLMLAGRSLFNAAPQNLESEAPAKPDAPESDQKLAG